MGSKCKISSSEFVAAAHTNIHSVCFLCRAKKGGFGGMFGMLKGLVGSKNLTQEDMEPVLDKMKDHLISMALLIPYGTSFKTRFVF